MSETKTGFVPRNQADGRPLQLAMQSLWLTGRVLPIGARLWIRHEFQSQEPQPVEVIYGFVLPRGAALRRFRITGEGFSVGSELRPTKDAREAYENGIRSGSLSTMAQQYRDGIVNLTVGNLRPRETVVVQLEIVAGVELHDDGLRLRFPFTLAPSYHSQARVIEAKPGVGEIELPEEEFGDLILPQFVYDAKPLHAVGFSLEVSDGESIQEIASPSHALRVENGGARVSLSRESDLPDRDLVLDIRRRTKNAFVISGSDHESKGRFAAVVPSSEFGSVPDTPRRLVILLDRSGSMQGTPIDRARQAIRACLGALSGHDLFGLIAFSGTAKVFRPSLVAAGHKEREAAGDFLGTIEATGGTELAAGLEAAASLLSANKEESTPGDVLIFTDGQVFATERVLEIARECGARIHCLGIGSASQDRFLAQLASQTGGVSRFVTPQERVDMTAIELFASVGRPVASGVRVSVTGVEGARILGEVPKYVFSGTPLAVVGEVHAGGNCQIQLDWTEAGSERQRAVPFVVAESKMGDTLKLIQGARLISDCESRYVGPRASGAVEKRESSRVRERLEQLSREFGLASSEMSLVAVVKRAGDIAGEIPKTLVVPVGLPVDMESASLFSPVPQAMCAVGFTTPPASLMQKLGSVFERASGRDRDNDQAAGSPKSRKAMASSSSQTPEDILVLLAGMIEPDGGMPGATEEIRVTNSLAALLFFVQQGNTQSAGPFRAHVLKLMRFLDPKRLAAMSKPTGDLTSRTLEAIRQGQTIPGDWMLHATRVVTHRMVHEAHFWSEVGAQATRVRRDQTGTR